MTDDTPQVQNQELSALAAEAAAADAIAAPPGSAGPTPAQVARQQEEQRQRQGEAQLLVSVARPLLEMLVPYIKGAPAEQWEALVDPVAGLLDHYQVDIGAWLNNPWAKLGAAAIPLAMSGVMRWQAEQDEKKRAATEPPSLDPAPDAVPVE